MFQIISLSGCIYAIKFLHLIGIAGCAAQSLLGNLSTIQIIPVGPLIQSSTIEGDRREDNVSPHATVGSQLSKDRWFLVYHTRGYRAVDEELSVLYQIREGKPDGRIIREGVLDSWNVYDS